MVTKPNFATPAGIAAEFEKIAAPDVEKVGAMREVRAFVSGVNYLFETGFVNFRILADVQDSKVRLGFRRFNVLQPYGVMSFNDDGGIHFHPQGSKATNHQAEDFYRQLLEDIKNRLTPEERADFVESFEAKKRAIDAAGKPKALTHS